MIDKREWKVVGYIIIAAATIYCIDSGMNELYDFIWNI